MDEVGALAAGGEGVEGFFQFGDFIEFGLEFFGDFEFGYFFELYFCAGFFEFDGFADVGFEGGFEFLNLCEGGEADDADGLGFVRFAG